MWFFSRDPARDFPFELGPPEPPPDPDPDPDPDPLWRLQRGRRKADGAPVSVFTHSLGDAGAAALARAALRRLRTLRHPALLGYLDSLETEQTLLVVTEPVTPLRQHLRLRPPQAPGGHQEVAWGLHRLLTALSFLGDSGLAHRTLSAGAIFVDPGGDWKLGGLERVGAANEEPPSLPPGTSPRPQDPPELSDPSRGRGEPWAGDMWRLGCLIWEIFNGPLARPAALRNLDKLPQTLLPEFCGLVAAEPRLRPAPDQLLQQLQLPGRFLDCDLVRVALLLERLQVLEAAERRGFLSELPELLPALPPLFRRHKLLPRLLDALRFGGADPSALPPMLQVASELPPPEFQARILPVLVRLFSSPDRALRVRLLQQLELYVELLPPDVVDSQIFPHVAHGFLDANPAVREQTVKSMVLLAPKLREATRGGELLRLLLRVQGGDALGPLRCNATLALGRLAPLLPPAARVRALPGALSRGTRDPFPPARAAAVAAFAAARGCFSAQDLALRALPPLCTLTADPDPGVRNQAFRTIRSFLDQLEEAAESGGAPEGAPPQGAGGAPGGGALGAAVSWAVTGVSAITARLMGGDGTPPGPPSAPSRHPGDPPERDPPPEPPPRTPPPRTSTAGTTGGASRTWSPPGAPPQAARRTKGPPQHPPAPDPPSAPQPDEGDWGVGGEWGSDDAWEALPPPAGPLPASRRLEPKRRGAPRGPPRRGPPSWGRGNGTEGEGGEGGNKERGHVTLRPGHVTIWAARSRDGAAGKGVRSRDGSGVAGAGVRSRDGCGGKGGLVT
ncbi:N-terminal kinase-like protein [Phaenicophaeus curvirostris]|uniref:N-terminal kinase-like protein n=1 Tax=Phaenicophaeus curvirostris TaxID=33595 RepID=UPI0037F0ADBA